ncbi:tetratricopeptide repeat protein [Clostridium aciditolerans]|uniref:Tetratricopeptide repeat protein n=1 Tax=Clostridium aciditolerans TaxID=339861 RepID=A0A934I3W6_9CLOT|nr:hypothetical protein [Clostridium aciditolerans]MBI6875612.1 hypothetical protein [Clostridium aciditolerans]
MAKNKMLKILGAVTVTVLLFFGSAFGTSKIVEVKKFNDLVNSANQKFNTGNYDEAITLYNEALQIKSDNDVIKNISIAQNYKQYQNAYNEGLKLITEKKYSEAIQKLSTINQMAGQVYTNAQSKIEECKKNIISEDIKATNTAISNKDYDSANKYVEDILKLDANNNDAKQLKTAIVQAQQKDKEEAEQENTKSVAVDSQETNNNQKVSKSSEQSQNKQSELDSINSELSKCNQYIATLDKGSQKYRDALHYKATLLNKKLDILKSQ